MNEWICFVGTSHAPQTLKKAALAKGLNVTDNISQAQLVFVAEDTPTSSTGERDVSGIRDMTISVLEQTKVPVVLSSQVPPGFCRALREPRLIHMAETLRIKDALERAIHPEQFVFGLSDESENLPDALLHYAWAHKGAKVLVMSYEEAEFSKIAINMMLAAQVDATNRLSRAAAKIGARWSSIRDVLRCDKRIGPEAYLIPGRWQESQHLLRDSVTLEEILAR